MCLSILTVLCQQPYQIAGNETKSSSSSVALSVALAAAASSSLSSSSSSSLSSASPSASSSPWKQLVAAQPSPPRGSPAAPVSRPPSDGPKLLPWATPGGGTRARAVLLWASSARHVRDTVPEVSHSSREPSVGREGNVRCKLTSNLAGGVNSSVSHRDV